MTLLYIFANNSTLILPQSASLAGIGSQIVKAKQVKIMNVFMLSLCQFKDTIISTGALTF